MVQFTTPTYYEAAETEWSDLDGEGDSSDPENDIQDTRKDEQVQTQEISATEAAKINGQMDDASGDGMLQQDTNETANANSILTQDTERAGEDSFDSQGKTQANRYSHPYGRDHLEPNTDPFTDSTASRTRNGTIRNTDSFFKDDTAEPKKLSLTPTLLREEQEALSPRTSDAMKEKSSSSSSDVFDQIERSNSSSSDKAKEDKKKRDKKPGMLSGLFKRKEKKLKVDEAAGGVVAKHGDGELGSPTNGSPSGSIPTSPRDRSPQSVARRHSSASSGGKLQKTPPSKPLSAANNPRQPGASGASSPPLERAKSAEGHSSLSSQAQPSTSARANRSGSLPHEPQNPQGGITQPGPLRVNTNPAQALPDAKRGERHIVSHRQPHATVRRTKEGEAQEGNPTY